MSENLTDYILLVNQLMKAPAHSDEVQDLLPRVKHSRSLLSSEEAIKADQIDKALSNYHS